MIPGSTAGDSEAKPAAYDAGQRAIADHCKRVGIEATVSSLPHSPGSYSVRRVPRSDPLVSIVMPTAGAERRLWGVETCLPTNAARRVLDVSSYPRIEWVVAFDAGCDDDTRDEVRSVWDDRFVEVSQAPGFNFSDAVNRGVQASTGDIIVLMNDDIEVLTPDWLEQFIASLDDPTVGSVGPKLLFPDFRVQSAGHRHGQTPEHLGRGLDRTDPGPFSALQIARECSSLTGALLATRRATWERVGGMAVELPNAYNDADFGNKLASLGLRNLWLPSVEAIHHETSTRDPHVPPSQLERFTKRWGDSYRNDKYAPAEIW
jgi:glycosyltransferase involved in cell wall biosynthesis